MDVDEMCRACMCRAKSLYPLLNSDYGRSFQEITHLQVDLDDDLPKYICIECLHDLLMAISFVDKCKKSQYAFKQIQMTQEPFVNANSTSLNHLYPPLALRINSIPHKTESLDSEFMIDYVEEDHSAFREIKQDVVSPCCEISPHHNIEETPQSENLACDAYEVDLTTKHQVCGEAQCEQNLKEHLKQHKQRKRGKISRKRSHGRRLKETSKSCKESRRFLCSQCGSSLKNLYEWRVHLCSSQIPKKPKQSNRKAVKNVEISKTRT